jgi:hypothetical protein
MTPQEKAKELFDKFRKYTYEPEYSYTKSKREKIGLSKIDYEGHWEDHCAKNCALICVNEIINEVLDNPFKEKYWIKVKNEIEKL